ncbi:uncharacterized protein N7469_007728 [Penicillium citrinum]|uniref:Ankyrin repeat protein n=1 Tax=Penicillium citrinum TaxID=5077 RepID=A0A9W9TK69_PENCI|nr:uncharacterized protein N7469_007728 [Penicillium citrinum]KAJ5224225.1 hypothetical protein N7469_007728 [Penicillium citrinum]
MALSTTVRAHSNQQLASIRPLADSLYESTCQSSALISQAHDELNLLLTVLAATEMRSSLLYVDHYPPALEQKLESCHEILLNIESLQKRSGEIGLHTPIMEIRGRISSLIFELNLMNADMMIFAQNKVNRSLNDFIQDVREGKRAHSVITDILDDTSATPEKSEAWENLQCELDRVGLPPHLSLRDRVFIISTLRHEVEEKDLLKDVKPRPSPAEIRPLPMITVSPSLEVVEKPAVIDIRPPLPPRPKDSGLAALAEKEVIVTKSLPILASTELQGVSDTEKQALPIDNYPIPVAVEAFFNAADDSDKQVMPLHGCPIPMSTNFPYSPDSLSNRETLKWEQKHYPLIFARTKKPSIMNKMKYRLVNSKESFISSIQMNNIESVKNALDQGASADTMNQNGQTALMVASSFGHEEVVKLLLQYGATTKKACTKGETALSVAAGRGHESIVRLLLSHQLEEGNGYSGTSGHGRTGLVEAAGSGNEGIVRLLLEHGASPNSTGTGGLTALSLAASNGYIDICHLLLNNGANVNYQGLSYAGKTPLWKAVQCGRSDIVSLLMARGADPLRKEFSGRTIVSFATTYGQTEIIKIFRQYGYEDNPVQYY